MRTWKNGRHEWRPYGKLLMTRAQIIDDGAQIQLLIL
jgi:hypothetical protein